MTIIIPVPVPAVGRALVSASVLATVPAVSAGPMVAVHWGVMVGRFTAVLSTVCRFTHTRCISQGIIQCRSMVTCLAVAMEAGIRDDVTVID